MNNYLITMSAVSIDGVYCQSRLSDIPLHFVSAQYYYIHSSIVHFAHTHCMVCVISKFEGLWLLSLPVRADPAC